MARFQQLTYPGGEHFKVRLSTIVLWGPEEIENNPKVKTRIVLALGSAYTLYIQEDYDFISAAMQNSTD